jgi:hypothetical protein
MIALHNSHTLLFLSITLHARCRCIVTRFYPKIDCVPPLRSHCFYRSTASATFAYKSCARRLRRRLNRNSVVVLRHLRNIVCTLREVEYIWLSQKTLQSTSSFPSQPTCPFIAQQRLFAYKPRCSALRHAATSYTSIHHQYAVYSCAENHSLLHSVRLEKIVP